MNKTKARKMIQKLLDKAKKADKAGNHEEARQHESDAYFLYEDWIKS